MLELAPWCRKEGERSVERGHPSLQQPASEPQACRENHRAAPDLDQLTQDMGNIKDCCFKPLFGGGFQMQAVSGTQKRQRFTC